VQVVIDGDNANTATTVLGYVTGVLRQASRGVPGRVQPVLATVEPRIWYNPELRSTGVSRAGPDRISLDDHRPSFRTALSIVRVKEARHDGAGADGAPSPRSAFVIGKSAPYLVMSQIGAMGIIGAAMIFFDLPMRGSWLSLFVVVTILSRGPRSATGSSSRRWPRPNRSPSKWLRLWRCCRALILSGVHFSDREHAGRPAVHLGPSSPRAIS
jgi:hypothetical protein